MESGGIVHDDPDEDGPKGPHTGEGIESEEDDGATAEDGSGFLLLVDPVGIFGEVGPGLVPMEEREATQPGPYEEEEEGGDAFDNDEGGVFAGED